MNKIVVYMHLNNINKKMYIGQTKDIKKRWIPSRYKNSPFFYSAILKYGLDNFSHTILKENLSQEEANYWEKYYIQKYSTTNENFGYNLAEGGAHSRVLVGKNNGFYGKKHTEESLKIMKEKKKGGNNPTAKKVRCLNTNEVFPSCREASDWCGISRQNIQRCCRGGRPSAGKHPITKEPLKWRYVEDEI